MSEDPRKKLVRQIGDRALDLDAGAERDEFIVRSCGGDPDLIARVTRYVTGADDPRFDAITPQQQSDPLTGQQIGRWTLEQKLGEGGLGVVYRAYRSDGHVRQNGAIKFLRGTVRSHDLETRFRDERQILANLHHPYIVGLIDGGVTEQGQPFLVMELVENGEPLDVYCRQRQLSLEQTLSLFQKVCEGVFYAHQRMVVHRDLKPANILVTPDGLPHLLDFGVAKILDPSHRSTGEAAHSSHVLLGTERYFSPEQARMEPLDQSTDIYSLGLILYELLTGTDPYDFESRMKETVQEIVCTVDPELPSQAINRRSRRPPSRHDLSGDLDAILIQALRKERTKRYSSANEFRDDLERHLTHQPVRARLNTVSYRASRFVRRNREKVIAAAAASALAVTLIGFGIVRLRHARNEATAETVRTLSQQSREASGTDPVRALKLAVQAVESTFKDHHYALPLAESALHDAVRRSHRRWEFLQAKASNALALDADGRRFAAAEGSAIEIWNVESKQRSLVLNAPGTVSSIAFNEDGTRLAAGTATGDAVVWDLKTGTELWKLGPHVGPVAELAFSPDGSRLATVDDGAIQIWDVESRRRVLCLQSYLVFRGKQTALFAPLPLGTMHHRLLDQRIATPLTMSWNGSRRRLVASTAGLGSEEWDVDKSVRIFEILQGAGGMHVKSDSAGLPGVTTAWNSNGELFATNEDRIVTVWSQAKDADPNARSWRGTDGTQFVEALTWIDPSPARRLAFAGKGLKRLALFSENHSIKVIDLRTGSEFLSTHGDRISISDSGTRLAAAERDHGVTIWEVAPESESTYLDSPLDGPQRLALSGNGAMMATVLPFYGQVALWDAVTGRELRTLGPADTRSFAVALNADGTRAVSIDLSGRASVWNTVTRQSLSDASLHFEALAATSTLVLNHDGTRVITIDKSGLQTIWKSGTGEKLISIERPRANEKPFGKELPADLAVFSPDSSRVATARAGVVQIWNSSNLATLASVSLQTPISSLAFDSTGHRIAVGNLDGRISIYDANLARVLQTVTPHQDEVTSLAFNAAGDRLASGSKDGTVQISGEASGELLLKLTPVPRYFRQPSDDSPPADSIRTLTFTGDGKQLIVGSGSGVRAVTLDTAELLRMAHALI
ncbi:MAG TPA: protein kinase [Bryobacteraceae bacterium]|jgi:serine/threonine protein kinase/WD40 repeat protein